MLDEMVRGKLESRSRIAALSPTGNKNKKDSDRVSERVTLPREYGACSDVRQQIERNLRRDSASLDRPRPFACSPRSPSMAVERRCPDFLDTVLNVLILTFSDLILIRNPPSLEERYQSMK